MLSQQKEKLHALCTGNLWELMAAEDMRKTRGLSRGRCSENNTDDTTDQTGMNV